MSYNYQSFRENIFTESGQRTFLKVRDTVNVLLKSAGAFSMEKILHRIDGDSWTMMACVDRLVELGEIVELTKDCWGQHRIFTVSQANEDQEEEET